MKHLKNYCRLMTAAVVMLTVSCKTQHEFVKPVQYNFLENLDPDSVLMLCPPPSSGKVTVTGSTWNGNVIQYGTHMPDRKVQQAGKQ